MPNFFNVIRARKFSSVSDPAVEISAHNSATPNFRIDAGGKLNWSSGSDVADTNLYRGSANTLKTDDNFDLATGQAYKINGYSVLNSTTLGSEVVNSSLTSVGTLTSLSVSGTVTATGTVSMQQSLEKVTVGGNLTGTTDINLLTSAVHMYTSTGDFTLNFQGNGSNTLDSLMSNNQAITAVVFVENTTARDLITVEIDDVEQFPYWFGGSQPVGNTDATDIYTLTIIKTGSSTFKVYASQSKFSEPGSGI
jgi:hypothetical protein